MKKSGITFFIVAALFSICCSDALSQVWFTGHTTMSFTDVSRNNRVIDTRIFYPADTWGQNVPLGSPSTKRFPIVIIGHDEGLNYNNYNYIYNLWAKKGFIVITPLTELAIPMDVEQFALDMAFIASEFSSRRNDPTFEYYHRFNNRTCLIGHGKGGSAAIIAASLYPDVASLITLAANETVPSAINAASLVTSPTVVVAAGQDCVSPVGTTQEAIFNNIAADCKAFINFTDASRCYFGQNAGYCVSNDVTCAPVSGSWFNTADDATWYLVSFIRYYLKYNAPALAKFEWKLQQKSGINYIIVCNNVGPRAEFDPDDNDLDLSDEISSINLEVYPNPVSRGNTLNFELHSTYNSKAEVMVTNMMGQIMHKETIQLSGEYDNYNISTDDLSKGNYLLIITDQFGGRASKPLVIN